MIKNIINLYTYDDKWFIEKRIYLFGLFKIKSLYLNTNNKWTPRKVSFDEFNNALLHFNQIS
jgi:hypothetical protein